MCTKVTIVGVDEKTVGRADASHQARMSARRVLAVLEGRDSDDVVLAHALDVVGGSGGYLTVVVLVSRPFPCINTGPLCGPSVSEEELWTSAEETLARVGRYRRASRC